jgi:hypothetical protein
MKHLMDMARRLTLPAALACAVWAASPGLAWAWSIATFNGWKATELKVQNRIFRHWCGPDHVVSDWHDFGKYGITIQNIATGELFEIPDTKDSYYVGSDLECRKVFHTGPLVNLAKETTMTLSIFDRVMGINAPVNTITDAGGLYDNEYLSYSTNYLIGEKGQEKSFLPDETEITILPVNDIIKSHAGKVVWARDDSMIYQYIVQNKSILCYNNTNKSTSVFQVGNYNEYTPIGIVISPDGKNLYIEFNYFNELRFGHQNILMRWDTLDDTHSLHVASPFADQYSILSNGKIGYLKRFYVGPRYIGNKIYIADGKSGVLVAKFLSEGESSNTFTASPVMNKLLLDIGYFKNKHKYIILSK